MHSNETEISSIGPGLFCFSILGGEGGGGGYRPPPFSTPLFLRLKLESVINVGHYPIFVIPQTRSDNLFISAAATRNGVQEKSRQ